MSLTAFFSYSFQGRGKTSTEFLLAAEMWMFSHYIKAAFPNYVDHLKNTPRTFQRKKDWFTSLFLNNQTYTVRHTAQSKRDKPHKRIKLGEKTTSSLVPGAKKCINLPTLFTLEKNRRR